MEVFRKFVCFSIFLSKDAFLSLHCFVAPYKWESSKGFLIRSFKYFGCILTVFQKDSFQNTFEIRTKSQNVD